MKLSSFCLLILLSVVSNAQQNYFSKRYDFSQSSWEGGISVLLADSTPIIFFQTTDAPGFSGALKVGLMLLNDTGGIVQNALYGVPFHRRYPGAFGGILKITNQTILLPGSLKDTLGQSDAILTMTDSFNVTWQVTYGDSLFQTATNCRRTQDNGFLLIGQTGVFNPNDVDIYTVRTDSNGTELWSKNHGGSYVEVGFGLDTCFDGGTILCGMTRSYGNGTPSNFANAYAIKTDSAGNEIWNKTFGWNFDERFYSCLQSKDSNYVFGGFYTYSDPWWPGNCCFSHSTPYIVKLDTAGNTIWEKKYGDPALDLVLTSIKELPNGGYISAGFFQFQDSAFDHYRGFILRVNNNGDSIWYINYRGLGGVNSHCYLHDITQTIDGGFIATGTVFPQPPDTGTQDIWVLKVDSNGCEVFNCLYTSTGEIINNTEVGISVYPNPSRGLFYLKKHTNEETRKCEVFDFTGKQVFYREGIMESIDLRSVTEGIYFYRVEMRDGKVWKGKLIKSTR